MGIWPNSTRMVAWWSPTKIVQKVLIGCISRSLVHKTGFLNAKKIFSETTRPRAFIFGI